MGAVTESVRGGQLRTKPAWVSLAVHVGAVRSTTGVAMETAALRNISHECGLPLHLFCHSCMCTYIAILHVTYIYSNGL